MTLSLIALDWGTSSLRAYRMGSDGRVTDRRSLPWGIMNLPDETPGRAESSPAQGFERAFQASCGDWLHAAPQTPVIACGMVGSAQGWREAGYLDLPTRLDGLAGGLVRVERIDGPPLHIIPGLIECGDLPDVMRGEETQVAGVLSMLANDAAAHEDVLIGLPGTHCKWVSVHSGVVRHFVTFMTGEIYAALCGHTILGRTMQDAAVPDAAAFSRGLSVTGGDQGRMGPLSTVFSSRTLGLTGVLPGRSQADYLSGLLIGHEVASVAASLTRDARTPHIVLCGDAALCRRYSQALAFHGLGQPRSMEQATERGLWQIAVAAGLLRV